MWMFPVDVMYEIVSRVPVKSVMRLRSVSKQFCGLIDSSEFINFHLNRSKETNLNSSIITTTDSKLLMTSMDSLENPVEIDYPLNGAVGITDSCNGLLALYERCDDNRALVNPSTKKHQILPRLPITDSDEKHYLAVDGFGYDAASGDYKLVCVVDFYLKKYYEIFVYSLKANSWKIVKDFQFPYNSFEFRRHGALAGGALHWVAWLQEPITPFIIAFDLKNDKFFAMGLPDHQSYSPFSTGVLGASLAITWRINLFESFDILVMKEYGIKNSWTKMFSFKPNHGFVPSSVKPLAYSKCGNKILYRQDVYHLAWYDLEKQTAEKLQIHGLPKTYGTDYIYTESLVSLDTAA